MRYRRLLAWLTLMLLASSAWTAPPAAEPSAADAELFEKEVRPLLIEKCWQCHGAGRNKGGLKLTSRAHLLEGGDSGPAVVAGKPEESLLVRAVRYQDAPRMPPKGKLTDRQIQALTRWVERGLPWPGALTAPQPVADRPSSSGQPSRFWAFQPVQPASLPRVCDTAWARSPMDRFIQSELEARGLTPSPPADRRALLRRVTFDLIGLPPTPAEIDAFLADSSPEAFARVVDRLLASPAYGERWGRHWLDVVRYADARDLIQLPPESDFREVWRYRDWVVAAFNRDLPYTDFIRHQIAGDLLPPSRPGDINKDGLVATGMLALADFVPGDVDKEQMIADYVNDEIDVIGRAFLGLTLACARCHDHKFDPITTEDYYALAGIFFSTRLIPGPVPGNTPLVRVPLLAPDELAKLPKKSRLEVPRAVVVQDGGPKGTRHEGFKDAQVYLRGNPKKLGKTVPRGFPRILVSHSQARITQGSGRRQLADWLASPDNPLTARVMVNRIWQHHFGEGLVRTPDNFGQRGERPTHPELLDYLARRFVESGWSVKAMHRLIVLSSTYQQSSRPSAAHLARDPENRLFGRMSRRRLEAEAIRDSLLAVAGRLSSVRGGPPFTDPAVPRRTLYLLSARTGANTSDFGRLFDRADPGSIVAQRGQSVVAPQALFFLNSPLVTDLARSLADRVSHEVGSADRDRIQHLYVLVLGRPPSQMELDLGLQLLAPNDAETWQRYCQLILCTNEFIYLD